MWLVWSLYACGVRRIKGLRRVLPLFYIFCSCFSSFVLLSWLASLGFLPCLLCCFFGFVGWFLCLVGLLILFPLRTASDIKRKGTKVLPLCPRLFYCVCLDSCIVIEVFLCRCFGFFQFARLILPTNASSIRRLARSYFYPFRHYVNITYNSPAFLK